MTRALRDFSSRRAMAASVFLIATAAQPAKAEIVWSHQGGPWQVTLFRGERGDAWCSWTIGGQPGFGRSQRSMSLQMRGENAVLFLFVGGLMPPRWRPGASITLSIDDREIAIELDLVRLLANGFSMSRGIAVQGAEAMARFATDLVGASSVSVMLPDGTSWIMDTAGLDATAPLMRQCLREAEAESALEPSR